MKRYSQYFKEEIIVDELGFKWDTELQEKLKSLKKGEHHKVICPLCEKVTNQCRCMSEDKTIIYHICSKCKGI